MSSAEARQQKMCNKEMIKKTPSQVSFFKNVIKKFQTVKPSKHRDSNVFTRVFQGMKVSSA